MACSYTQCPLVMFFWLEFMITAPFFVFTMNSGNLIYLLYIQQWLHPLPFMDVALFINATSLMGSGAHFTLWFGAEIRGDLTQTKTLSYKPIHSITLQLLLLWSFRRRRLQPSRVGSIIIAL